MAIRVQTAAFDPGAEVNALHAANLGVGAVVSFVGYVRDFNDGRDVAGMFLEHYPGMTEKALARSWTKRGSVGHCSGLKCCTVWVHWNRVSRSCLWEWPVPIARRRSMPVRL